MVTVTLTDMSRRFKSVSRYNLGKFTKFWGHRLNGCEVIPLFSEEGGGGGRGAEIK